MQKQLDSCLLESLTAAVVHLTAIDYDSGLKISTDNLTNKSDQQSCKACDTGLMGISIDGIVSCIHRIGSHQGEAVPPQLYVITGCPYQIAQRTCTWQAQTCFAGTWPRLALVVDVCLFIVVVGILVMGTSSTCTLRPI